MHSLFLSNRKSITSDKGYFLSELLCMIHMNIKHTSAFTPDGGLINGVGPLSQGKHLSVVSNKLTDSKKNCIFGISVDGSTRIMLTPHPQQKEEQTIELYLFDGHQN